MCKSKGFKPNSFLAKIACLSFLLASQAIPADPRPFLKSSDVFDIIGHQYLPRLFSQPDPQIHTIPETDPKQVYHSVSAGSEKIEFWQRLTQHYALPTINRRSIRQEIRWLQRNPDYLERVQLRAAPFLPYILEQITNNQMPGELALLPIVESAFRAHAHSPKQAVGIWQFIPATGKRYGLAQNWWYDGRMDIHASTQAALKYLKKLHKQFDNDWLLAVAAYNCGETKVARLRKANRKQNKKTDFWSLPLPRETRSYVPRLLAVSQLFAHPERYGIKRLPVSEVTLLKTVRTDSPMDLAIIADLVDIPLQQLYKFNPGFKRWSTGPDQDHTWLIPSDDAERFSAVMATKNQEELLQIIPHQVTKNETLGHIAEQYSVELDEIVHYNKLSSKTIQAGEKLHIPIAIKALASYGEALASAASIAGQETKKTGIRYTVQRNDTIWEIAKLFSVSADVLTEQNALQSKNMLYAGQKLVIPVADKDSSVFHYHVQKGDSLSLIATRFNVKTAHLRRWNTLTLGRHLKPGQKLLVRLPDSAQNI